MPITRFISQFAGLEKVKEQVEKRLVLSKVQGGDFCCLKSGHERSELFHFDQVECPLGVRSVAL